jgi:beta-glucanase (GH16 family)
MPKYTYVAGMAGVACMLLLAAGVYKIMHPSQPTAKTQTAVHRQSDAPNVDDTRVWSKIFDDEFSENTLDRHTWATCYEWYDTHTHGCTNSGNNEQEWYVDDQVSVADGHAILTAIDQPITVQKNGAPKTFSYRSGMISTGRKTLNGSPSFQAAYGYYEARIKFDGGKGIWPAFWLLPTDKKWPPEIDIMEFLGQPRNKLLLTYHWGDTPEQHQQDSSIIYGPDYTNGWHTYAVNWQPGTIEWFVDGVLKKSATDTTVPNKPMQIIVNLAVGGVLPGNADTTTTFPSHVYIDYMRAYGKVMH